MDSNGTYVLKISFLLESGKTKTLTLADPKSNITSQEIKALAKNIIDNELLLFAGSAPTELKEYYIYQTNTIPIE